MEVRGVANRSEGLGAWPAWAPSIKIQGPGWSSALSIKVRACWPAGDAAFFRCHLGTMDCHCCQLWREYQSAVAVPGAFGLWIKALLRTQRLVSAA